MLPRLILSENKTYAFELFGSVDAETNLWQSVRYLRYKFPQKRRPLYTLDILNNLTNSDSYLIWVSFTPGDDPLRHL